MAKKQRIYACWTVDSEDLAEAVAQLCEETPIICDGGGIELSEGALTVSFSNEPRRLSAFIRFEAPAPEGFSRKSLLSPIDLMGKSAYDFGRFEDHR
jgi:hypothetical protein